MTSTSHPHIVLADSDQLLLLFFPPKLYCIQVVEKSRASFFLSVKQRPCAFRPYIRYYVALYCDCRGVKTISHWAGGSVNANNAVSK